MFRQKPTYYLLVLLCLWLFSSCVTNRTTRYLQDVEHNYPKVEHYPEYTIQPNDELNIQIFSSNPEALKPFLGSSQGTIANQRFGYIVETDSTITLPFVSQIKVGGLTLDEAGAEVQSRLQAFVTDTFAVRVLLSNKVFYMLGEGGRGSFPVYKDRMTIFEALAAGGEPNISANRKKIKIMRNTAEGMKIMEFDLRSKDILDSEYYYILPNDIIYAERGKRSFYYQITSFSAFMGAITSTASFVLLVLQYSTTK